METDEESFEQLDATLSGVRVGSPPRVLLLSIILRLFSSSPLQLYLFWNCFICSGYVRQLPGSVLRVMIQCARCDADPLKPQQIL
jgi:hypothetical protein